MTNRQNLVRPESKRPLETVTTQLAGMKNIALPQGKQLVKPLMRALSEATEDNPFTIYVGSCPDYSHENGTYTHEGLGNDVPLLTLTHLANDPEFLQILDQNDIPYSYTVMVADVEAIDQIFCDKFSNGDQELFLANCQSSVLRTANTLEELKSSLGLSGELRSSSFFSEFGMENFLHYQAVYAEILAGQCKADSSFRMRVKSDIMARMAMYRKMYAGVLDEKTQTEREEFLVERTIRTMAQYMTLGRLISQSATYPAIINHPTTNLGFFNKRNSLPLPEDGNQPQPTVPVLEMLQRTH